MKTPRKKMIIGLDLGLTTGWALLFPNGTIESGTYEIPEDRGESRGMRFARWRGWFIGLLEDWQPGLVAYEQAHARGGAATDVLVGLATRVQECCAERGIEYVPIHTSTLKKWATGNGAAKKAAMVEAATARAGRTIESDDEADAYLVVCLAAEKWGEG